MDDQWFADRDSYLSRLIRRKARLICDLPAFSRSDREDVAQDLVTHLLEKRQRFDPSNGASFDTWATTVICNATVSLIRRAFAEKRRPGCQVLSLHDLVPGRDGEEIPLSETVADPKAATPHDIDREADVADFISRLSGIDAQVACLRLVGLNDLEIRSALGLKRRGLERCLRNVERLAREMGLEEYLPRRTSPRGDGVDQQ